MTQEVFTGRVGASDTPSHAAARPARLLLACGVLAGSLFITVALARRVDHAWMLVRRAAGFEQKNGALERIFIVTAGIAVVGFAFWFLIIAGPGPEIAPKS